MAKKKVSRNLVPVGTHVEPATKLGLQALAESQNTTVYAIMQELIEDAVAKYEEQLDDLRGPKEVRDGEDLLG